MRTSWLNAFALALACAAIGLLGFRNFDHEKGRPLLNVSYDPTREVFDAIDTAFVAKYETDTGNWIGIEQSHGGSTKQAQAVVQGLDADVVTLALPSDIEILQKHGLIASDWARRFPNESRPYFSTIVFVVRKGNPKHIRDWPDLVANDVTIVTPDPATSGNGKLSFLAAWGSVIYQSGSEAEALNFVGRLYRHVAVLGQGARDSSTTFALEGSGDVQLTWENEALREASESKGDLLIVYPSVSIRAEPSVTWVDANVSKHHSEAVAQAYLGYLFTDPAQELLAKGGYRPINEQVLKNFKDRFPEMTLFPITLVARDWDDAQNKFFSENGIFSAVRPAMVR